MTETSPNVVPMAPKPTVSHVSVTPDIAARWLANNHVNRTVREAKVNQYASDMAAGRWTLSNDAICFAQDGRLLNGQHRLNAVVRSGSTVVLLVARNMPVLAMTTMDSGIARTAADALTFAGEVNTHILAATARLAALYDDGRIYRDRHVQGVSHTEIQDFVDTNGLLRHSVHVGGSLRQHIDCAPSILATAHWIIARRAGVAVADHYFQQLGHRHGEPQGSAVLAVDSRLRQLRRQNAKLSARAYLYLLVKGWNHYARDSRVASLTIKSDARIPDPIAWQR